MLGVEHDPHMIPQAASWDVSRIQEGHSEVPRFVLLATALMRLVACFFSFAAAVAIHLESSIQEWVLAASLFSFFFCCIQVSNLLLYDKLYVCMRKPAMWVTC